MRYNAIEVGKTYGRKRRDGTTARRKVLRINDYGGSRIGELSFVHYKDPARGRGSCLVNTFAKWAEVELVEDFEEPPT